MACRICKRPAGEHHEFESFEAPKCCVCDSITWEPNEPGPICAKYEGDGRQNCAECEHDQACHGQEGV